jgi:hypothetical protein
MIGQTIAIFVDAYRELNARKLFWITVIISAVLVLAFALVGVDAKGLSIVTFHMDLPRASFLYKYLFDFIIIGLWLTWAATVLALVSTAGLFPEFISGGSVDLYLSKPIGRARLFLTKYMAGLLFVTLQVGVVAVGSYFVMGIRGHNWNPKLFLAVPIVVCFFSYLFAFCVLLGVKTRSTIAALLLTLLFWTFLAVLDRSEPGLLMFQNINEAQAKSQQNHAAEADKILARAQRDPKQAAMVIAYQEDSDSAHREANSTAHTARVLKNIHAVVYAIKTLTPKTTDTLGLLDLYIFPTEQEANYEAGVDPDRSNRQYDEGPPAETMADTTAGAKKTVEALRSRSPWWIVGTSLAFEVVLVGCAMWIFCRRDY